MTEEQKAPFLDMAEGNVKRAGYLRNKILSFGTHQEYTVSKRNIYSAPVACSDSINSFQVNFMKLCSLA